MKDHGELFFYYQQSYYGSLKTTNLDQGTESNTMRV